MTQNKRADKDGEKIKIKKYANRRLYNTATSSYVTLDHLSQMVKDGIDFVVHDAKTGEDITRAVLTHIIVEEEGKGQNLLPISFLRQLISFYGDSLQAVVPRYLEMSMEALARNQEQLRETFGHMFPFPGMEEVSKQNMAMFEQAMRMFSPFSPGGENASGQAEGWADRQRPQQTGAGSSNAGSSNAGSSGAGPSGAGPSGADLRALSEKLNEMQRQLDALNKKPEGEGNGEGNDKE